MALGRDRHDRDVPSRRPGGAPPFAVVSAGADAAIRRARRGRRRLLVGVRRDGVAGAAPRRVERAKVDSSTRARIRTRRRQLQRAASTRHRRREGEPSRDRCAAPRRSRMSSGANRAGGAAAMRCRNRPAAPRAASKPLWRSIATCSAGADRRGLSGRRGRRDTASPASVALRRPRPRRRQVLELLEYVGAGRFVPEPAPLRPGGHASRPARRRPRCPVHSTRGGRREDRRQPSRRSRLPGTGTACAACTSTIPTAAPSSSSSAPSPGCRRR